MIWRGAGSCCDHRKQNRRIHQRCRGRYSKASASGDRSDGSPGDYGSDCGASRNDGCDEGCANDVGGNETSHAERGQYRSNRPASARDRCHGGGKMGEQKGRRKEGVNEEKDGRD